jgi:hypothetical protein
VEKLAWMKQRVYSSTACKAAPICTDAGFFQQGKPNKTGLKKMLKNRLRAM